MVFTEAFEKGRQHVEAFKETLVQREAELEEIFTSLNTALLQATNGNVAIRLVWINNG